MQIYKDTRMILDSNGEEMQKGVEEFLDTSSHIIANETIGHFSVKKDCPKLAFWATQCMKRESVSKALADPNKIYELFIAYRKKAGVEN
ncbi:hypothetical protein L1987_49201 [Smallanthus sonchifolius]|uniref:Uncharacterized protein n=1 Tax=Smallanthus sonchifolius TaxID=185202 RepID=A0ACB9FVQ2_9ASTR|nr:hypothetical protein L1987_49201 [Smallanthus sonchifolius]